MGFYIIVLSCSIEHETETAQPTWDFSASWRLTCYTLRTLVSDVGDSHEKRECENNYIYQFLVSSSAVQIRGTWLKHILLLQRCLELENFNTILWPIYNCAVNCS